jgi:hypothetical protein
VIDVQASIVLAKGAIDDAPEYGFSQSVIDLANDMHEQANYSLTFIVADGSGGSHNPVYAQQLLDFAGNKSTEIIDLLTPGTVEGRVVDGSGSPVEGVAVIVDGLTMATTESDGRFSFPFAPGAYTFSLKLKGNTVGSIDSVLIASLATTNVGDVTITEETLFLPLVTSILIIVLLVSLVIFMFYRMQKSAPRKTEEEAPEEEEEET